jgi:pilus assembly protein CpaB
MGPKRHQWEVKRMKAARIAVLVVAVGAGGVAAYLASGINNQPAPPPAEKPVVQIDTTEILVAKNDLNMGQVVTAQDIAWQVWPSAAASPSFLRKSEHADAIKEFTGAIARSPFVAGEPIRPDKLIRADGSGFMAALLPSGMRAISTDISPETGAGGFILPNDRVDVILTRRDRETEKVTGIEAHVSETILRDIRVLAIDQTIEDKGGVRVVVGKTATLELTPHQSETLAVSRQRGIITLALRSLIDANAPKVADDDGKSIVVYRGVERTVTTLNR